MGDRIASMIKEFHCAIRKARYLRDAGRGDEAVALLASTLDTLPGPAVPRETLPEWLRTQRKGNGFHSTLGFGSRRFHWTVEAPDGVWETVCCDVSDEEIYWGGEIGSDSLEGAVAEALRYQVAWPEAAVEIMEGVALDGGSPGPVVLRIPPVYDASLPRGTPENTMSAHELERLAVALRRLSDRLLREDEGHLGSHLWIAAEGLEMLAHWPDLLPLKL